MDKSSHEMRSCPALPVLATHQGTREGRDAADAAVDLCLAVADLHRQGRVDCDLWLIFIERSST
ncbi:MULTISPECIES: hypothetical protein [Streptomyces]|jgi:hypothetical protein|uniref:Uncharacterized protein n=2 Tax=Streptomyces TaxID=1883 RepID=A0A7W7U7T8_9ACTN|nr:hypothetical protein [Streptomyces nymphaeiformis]MBB4986590.1 hypothetical protein [Streptomyces nymphaeiformis]